MWGSSSPSTQVQQFTITIFLIFSTGSNVWTSEIKGKEGIFKFLAHDNTFYKKANSAPFESDFYIYDIIHTSKPTNYKILEDNGQISIKHKSWCYALSISLTRIIWDLSDLPSLMNKVPAQ